MSRPICLLYHRINEYHDYYNMSVTPNHFDEQMEYLNNHYKIIRFCDNWNATEEASIVITFDDGYADNYEFAYPILRKYSIPATIFVCTENIGTNKMFWWDDILHICLNRKNNYSSFALDDPLLSYTWKTENKTQCLNLAYDLRSILRREKSEQVFYNIRMQLLDWAGGEIEVTNNRSMSENELCELDVSGLIDLGGHTVTHHSLGPRSYEEQYKDCQKSIKTLKRIVGKDIKAFSYPFGGPRDYNEDTIKIMEELGIEKAATTELGMATDYGNYRVPRLGIKDCNIEEFKRAICSVIKQ